MFEYLMPLLVRRSYDHTLLDETYGSAVDAQIAYGARRSVPWGVSESAYNLMDLAMTYQYRAFGVPGLGLKAGLGEDLVVAPYATALAALVRPRARGGKSARARAPAGMLGGTASTTRSITRRRTSLQRAAASIVKTIMSHHQGMMLVALDNVLHDNVMQNRFHRDPRVKATELLLEERVPTNAPLTIARASVMPSPRSRAPIRRGRARRIALRRAHARAPARTRRAHDDRHCGGRRLTTWRGLDVYRFREDRSLEAGGIYMYVRNHTTHEKWSAGYQPMRVEPKTYTTSFAIDRVTLSRRDGDIETTSEIVVSPEHPVEVRRITFTNHGDKRMRPRRHDVHRGRPRAAIRRRRASRLRELFIETEVLRERGAVLAHRRAKSAAELHVGWSRCSRPGGGAWKAGLRARDVARPLRRAGSHDSRPAGLEGSTAQGPRAPCSIRPSCCAALSGSGAGGPRTPHADHRVRRSREEPSSWSLRYSDAEQRPAGLELAWADARVELKHVGHRGGASIDFSASCRRSSFRSRLCAHARSRVCTAAGEAALGARTDQ